MSRFELLCAGKVGTSGISGYPEALAEQLQLLPHPLASALPDVRKPMADAQTYHILGSQQQYALFLLRKGTTDENFFRVAVWICHLIHLEQRQPSLRGTNAAKTHCGSNTPLPDKDCWAPLHSSYCKTHSTVLCPIRRYARVPGEG